MNHRNFPLKDYKSQFLELLRNNQMVIVVEKSGIGKTTLLPQWCLEWMRGNHEKFKLIGCTLPNMMSTINVAERVAEELRANLGEEVGYNVKFEDRTSDRTMLKYTTDEMLLRDAISSPLLPYYGVILLDDVNERTVYTDILMGLLKNIVSKRSDLKIVLMSTTEDIGQFQNYFGNVPFILVPDNLYPVDIEYIDKIGFSYLECVVDLVIEIHKCEKDGDILVFLFQDEEIEEACKWITDKASNFGNKYGKLECIPCFYKFSKTFWKRLLEPHPLRHQNEPVSRKVVLTTYISQACHTFNGVSFVIDLPIERKKVLIPNNDIHGTMRCKISKRTAMQRSNHAGWTRPGKCYRIFRKEIYENMVENTVPDILRCNLVAVVLLMMKIGLDIEHFNYLEKPKTETLEHVFDILKSYGAIDREYYAPRFYLTDLGMMMAEFPLDPQLAMAVIASCKYNCSDEILTIAAMLSVPQYFDVQHYTRFFVDNAKVSCAGDHLTMLNVYKAFKQSNESTQWCDDNFVNHETLNRAVKVRTQLYKIFHSLSLSNIYLDCSSNNYYENMGKALLSGYFMQVAYFDENKYCTLKHMRLLTKNTCLDHQSKWILFMDYEDGRMQTLCEVKPQWLAEVVPHYFKVQKCPNCNVVHFLLRNYQSHQCQ